LQDSAASKKLRPAGLFYFWSKGMSRASGLLLLGVTVLFWPAPSVAVTVLGVPIGEKLTEQPPVCPSKKDTFKQMCWLGRPTAAPGGARVVKLHLPADSRPAWAGNQPFTASITKEGAIEELKLPNVPARDRAMVVRSVSKQFGTPRAAGEQGSTAWARWAAEGVHVGMACEDERCLVTIRTDVAEAAARRQAEARKTTDAGNPRAP
jgi:hypothetical protein